MKYIYKAESDTKLGCGGVLWIWALLGAKEQASIQSMIGLTQGYIYEVSSENRMFYQKMFQFVTAIFSSTLR